MTAKEYLSQAWQLKLRIESMTEIAAFMRSVAEMVTPHMSHTPKPAARNIHKNEDAIVKLVDYEQRIADQRRKLDRVLATIESIADSAAQSIIVKRYIDRKTWTAIASETYISLRQVHRLHESVLAEIDSRLKDGTL